MHYFPADKKLRDIIINGQDLSEYTRKILCRRNVLSVLCTLWWELLQKTACPCRKRGIIIHRYWEKNYSGIDPLRFFFDGPKAATSKCDLKGLIHTKSFCSFYEVLVFYCLLFSIKIVVLVDYRLFFICLRHSSFELYNNSTLCRIMYKFFNPVRSSSQATHFRRSVE